MGADIKRLFPVKRLLPVFITVGKSSDSSPSVASDLSTSAGAGVSGLSEKDRLGMLSLKGIFELSGIPKKA